MSFNNNDAIIVGDGGVAFVTEDAGDSWTDLALGVSDDLVDIDGDDDEDIMVILADDYQTWYTTGDGTSWTAAAAAPTAGPTAARDVAVTTTSMWYVIGSLGSVYKTSNKGATWATQGVGGLYSLNAVDFITSTKGIIVGNGGEIFTTIDGGSTWSTATSGTTEDLHDVRWINSSLIWAVGDNGTILVSEDAGSSWATETIIFGTNDLYSIDNRGSNRIALIGDGTAYYTADQGSNWSVHSVFGSGIEYRDAAFPTDDTFWAVGGDGTGDMIVSKLDEEAPVITNVQIDGGSPGTDTTPTVTVSATDNAGSGGLTYRYIADGVLDQEIGSDEVGLLTVLSDGSHTISVIVEDDAGNDSDQYDITYVVDLHDPVISTVSPISATAGTATTLSVTTSDSTNLTCNLYINSADQGVMTDGGDVYTYNYTFAVAGNYTAQVECTDEVGFTETGIAVTVTVGEATITPDPEPEPEPEPEVTPEPEVGASEADPGTLIKMACDADRMVNDPCTAVYFYATDGKRHAFPNEKVYFTWYENFDDVIVVTSDFMASLDLGSNVTYHPGTKMVKFLSVNTVYAVEKGGVLRAIDSEATATALYGSNWNTKIDDINDAFFGNYSFGDDIESASDYDVDDAIASVSDLDDNF